ncbi:MAG: hypothetical protein ACR2PL_19060 [Dehalococcoidia bacterium]
MNFSLHGRYLMQQPVNAMLVYLSSGVDLAIITIMVAFWSEGQGIGLRSPFFVLYYPVVLAFALVFPPRVTLRYGLAVISVYLAAVLLISGFGNLADQKALLERLITLAAAAGLGTYFWRMQRRRRKTGFANAALVREIETLTSSVPLAGGIGGDGLPWA